MIARHILFDSVEKGYRSIGLAISEVAAMHNLIAMGADVEITAKDLCIEADVVLFLRLTHLEIQQLIYSRIAEWRSLSAQEKAAYNKWSQSR